MRIGAPGSIEPPDPASAIPFRTVITTESVATALSESWAVTVKVVVADGVTTGCVVVRSLTQSEQTGCADQA
jgi:hypothetical protein